MASKINTEISPPKTPSPCRDTPLLKKFIVKSKWWETPEPDSVPPLTDSDSLASGPYPWAERIEIEKSEFADSKASGPVTGPVIMTAAEEPFIVYKGYNGSKRLPPRRNFLYPWAALSEENLTQYGLNPGTGYYSIAHRHAMIRSNGNSKALRAIMALQEAFEIPTPPEPYNLAGFTGLEHKERIFCTNTVIDLEGKPFDPRDPHGHVIGLRQCRTSAEILRGWEKDAAAKKARELAQKPEVPPDCDEEDEEHHIEDESEANDEAQTDASHDLSEPEERLHESFLLADLRLD